MQACDRCHARKTRCDRRIPRCGGCEKAGVPCLHVDKLRSRNLPRAYVDDIEGRLRAAQGEIHQLRAQLAQTGGLNSSTTAEVNDFNQLDHPGDGGASISPSVNVGRTDEDAMATAAMGSSETPADDAVASEVGHLTLTMTGETRFLGSSSGIGLASIISGLFGAQRASFNLSKEDGSSQDGQESRTNASPIESQLPARDLAMQSIEAYFQHTHISFPLLHRPTFLAAVERIYSDPVNYPGRSFDEFAFEMVLAIAEGSFNRFPYSAGSAAKHCARALARMQAILDMRGLIPLRGILLLGQHLIFSNMLNTTASIWHLIGIAARMCVELGLHLDPTHRPGANQNGSISFEMEMQRRTFWCFYNLDRVVSFTLGRPTALADENIDTSFPTPLDDDTFGPDNPITTQMLRDGRETSPFLQLIEIRRLSGQILSTFYSARRTGDIPLDQKLQTREHYYDRIMAWRTGSQSLHLPSPQSRGDKFTSCFLTPTWWEAVANNALLLLYRPSPYLPGPVVPTTPDGKPGDLQRLVFAAKTAITSYSDLHRRRNLNYSWITLHGIFLAGLTYVYGIRLALENPAHQVALPEYVQIIDDTRTCSNMLVAICERWSIARRSCDIFDRLSNAVIKDAINASTGSTRPNTTRQEHAEAHPHAHRSGGMEFASAAPAVENADGEGAVLTDPFDPANMFAYNSDQAGNMVWADEMSEFWTGLDRLFSDVPTSPLMDWVESS
ncbi:fungal-specific transcription factor domain-containing protein [Neohortaea acidophila]|uniref:Fungal-specific transcription factor domain-containing protein n=1 Tax=Neohortaea acidophila TaxID=245834 RepID=A0A6A6PYT6_9PEZI|nr:fungal-specific transcription factor domain-containing protein [Neohortaea acidophila]KAF2484911.1 fungal-specific transcription factor domain-containing protein [Neohortaea acidophila]